MSNILEKLNPINTALNQMRNLSGKEKKICMDCFESHYGFIHQYCIYGILYDLSVDLTDDNFIFIMNLTENNEELTVQHVIEMGGELV